MKNSTPGTPIFGWPSFWTAALSAIGIYLSGYFILLSADFFELSRMPCSPGANGLIYRLFQPLEFLRMALF